MNEPAARAAFTSRPLPEGVRIEIPTARNWFVLAFLPFVLCGWASGEGVLIWKLHALFAEGGGPGLTMSLWLLGWTLGGLLAWVSFFWFLVGSESIEVSSTVLTLSRKIGPFVRRKDFNSLRVRDLRPSPLVSGDESPVIHCAVRGCGLIAFDYGSRTHRFGAVPDVTDARRVCIEIARWLPPSASAPSEGVSRGP